MPAKGNGWRQKVDKAAKINFQIKQLTEELSKLKKELRDYAELRGMLTLEGYKYRVDFGPYKRTDIDPADLFNYLRATNQLDTVPELMRPNMSAINKDKELRQNLAPYITIKQDNWGKICFSVRVKEIGYSN